MSCQPNQTMLNQSPLALSTSSPSVSYVNLNNKRLKLNLNANEENGLSLASSVSVVGPAVNSQLNDDVRK